MFRFRLQRVLELRAQKERDAATSLARANEAAEVARAERDALSTARDELATAGQNAAATVGELQNLSFLLARLDERVEEAGTAVDAAEQTVQQVQGELLTAHQERRAFDRLRDRHHEQWRTTTGQQDRQRMDEIALARFTHRTPPDGSTSPKRDQ